MDKTQQIEDMASVIRRATPWGRVLDLEESAEALYAAGYRKLPKKPKVLTQTQIDQVRSDPNRKLPLDLALIQAQYDADIKHIWGEDA